MNTFLALVYVAYSSIQRGDPVIKISDDCSDVKEIIDTEEGREVVDDMERQRER